jgi:hypothetical protein
MSCDFEPTDVPGPHYQGDVRDLLGSSWDILIAHPPCTFLCNSSSKHLYIGKKKENGRDEWRWEELRKGAAFFKMLWEQDIPRIAIENPIMLGYAKDIIGSKQSQLIQPWMFGDPEQKATCLWLKELPPLIPTYPKWADCREALGLPDDAKPKQAVHEMGPSDIRWKLRSATYPGIANAMAQQWG